MQNVPTLVEKSTLTSQSGHSPIGRMGIKEGLKIGKFQINGKWYGHTNDFMDIKSFGIFTAMEWWQF